MISTPLSRKRENSHLRAGSMSCSPHCSSAKSKKLLFNPTVTLHKKKINRNPVLIQHFNQTTCKPAGADGPLKTSCVKVLQHKATLKDCIKQLTCFLFWSQKQLFRPQLVRLVERVLDGFSKQAAFSWISVRPHADMWHRHPPPTIFNRSHFDMRCLT